MTKFYLSLISLSTSIIVTNMAYGHAPASFKVSMLVVNGIAKAIDAVI